MSHMPRNVSMSRVLQEAEGVGWHSKNVQKRYLASWYGSIGLEHKILHERLN